jgi:hypothetical protein
LEDANPSGRRREAIRKGRLLNPPGPIDDGLFGDYNDDGTVNAADYALWRDNLRASTTLPNDSSPGSVLDVDYAVWKANFGAAEGTASGHSVPEPTGMALAAIAVILMGRLLSPRRSIFLTP